MTTVVLHDALEWAARTRAFRERFVGRCSAGLSLEDVRAELERALYHGLDAFKLREVSPAWEEVAG